MDLKKQSEIISCNRISFLDRKYNLHNDYLFRKQLISKGCGDNLNNNQDNDKNNYKNNGYLKSSFITKKDCIYQSTEPDMGEWEQQFEINNNNNYNNNKQLFNINTKAKLNQDVNCP